MRAAATGPVELDCCPRRRGLRAIRLAALVCAVVALWAAAPAQAGLAPPGQLPIGFWCGPPTAFVADAAAAAARMAEIKAAGFNMASPPCEPPYDTATNQRVLTAAQQAGIKVIVSDQRLMDAVAGGSTAQLDQVLADYASYPALGGYYLADEPLADAFSRLGAVVSYLRARDPEHPAYVNVNPDFASPGQLGVSDYATYLDQYLGTSGISLLSYDHYPTDGFFTNLASARAAAAAHGVPFWQIVLSTQHLSYDQPTQTQKLWEGMQTLAYGGKGVMFFTYWTVGLEDPDNWGEAIIDGDGTPTSQYSEIADVNAQLQTIGQALLGATNRYTFQNGKPVAGAIERPVGAPVQVVGSTPLTIGVFDDGTYLYTLVTNRDADKARTAMLQLATGTSPLERLSPSGTWSVASAAGSATAVGAALPAGGGVLYRTALPVAPIGS
jgi:hypothetical protein